MSDINIGVPVDYPVPGDYLQINFGVGPGGGDQGQAAILIIGNKTSAGSGTVDTEVYGPNSSTPLQNETDMIGLAGTGSEAHRIWLRVRRVLDLAETVGVTAPPVYAIFPTESVGVAASLDFLIANVSTGTAVLRFYCGDDFCDTQVANTEAVDTLGAALAVSINNQTRWPITASYNSGTDTLTVTARQKGPRGNEIRVWAKIISGSTATTITNNASTPLASGATADSWTTALATIVSTRYYYIASPSSDVAGTTYDDLVTQVLSQALPISGIRQRVFAGFVGTLANGSTVAANALINTERSEIYWLQTAELTAGEIAGHTAAVHAVFETLDWSYNFRDFGLGEIRGIDTAKFWKIPAPQTKANWPTAGTAGSLAAALNGGLTPIGVTTSGQTYITRSITTRHKNGSNFDYRARDSHIVSVLDHWADRLLADITTKFGGSKIIDDLGPGETVPDPRTVQPTQIKALVFQHIDDVANSQFKKAAEIKSAVIVQRDSHNLNRVGIQVPARVIDLLFSTTTKIDDNSTAA